MLHAQFLQQNGGGEGGGGWGGCVGSLKFFFAFIFQSFYFTFYFYGMGYNIFLVTAFSFYFLIVFSLLLLSPGTEFTHIVSMKLLSTDACKIITVINYIPLHKSLSFKSFIIACLPLFSFGLRITDAGNSRSIVRSSSLRTRLNGT